MEDMCLKCIRLNGNKNEWENNSQSPASLEESVMVMAKIFIYWVTRDIAEPCHVFYISVKWKIGALERETELVRSALNQNFRLKI